MGLFSKKPKSIIVQKPAVKPVAKPNPDGVKTPKSDSLSPKSDIEAAIMSPSLTPTLAATATPTPIATSSTSTPTPTPAPTPSPTPTPKSAAPPPPLEMPRLAPKVDQLPPPKPGKPAKPAKQKNRKGGVDPADFLALRTELIHMKARLDESEQARAVVEARLGALDAAASTFTSERADISEVAGMVVQLQQELAERTGVGAITGDNPIVGPAHEELAAKVDALQNRLFGMQDHGDKLAEVESQLASMRVELAATAEAATTETQQAVGPDPETLQHLAMMQQRLEEVDSLKQRLGEIDQLQQRVSGLGDVEQRLASVDGLAAQLQQLNARVAAQAEFGGQLSALRDRVAQLGDPPQGIDDGVRLQLQEIGERLQSSEELRSQIGQLAERMSSNDNEARAVREHMALLDQRLTNVGTELANQISELGSDIDGLGQRVPEIVDGSVSDEVVEALRGGQVKLANEQARYEIAFRQDLAALAEQLRRGNG